MAKQTEDIIVKLGLEGFKELSKIRSSFRDLGKVTNMTERDIISVRDSLFDFAKAAGNTEAVNKGLTSALQGLRTQANLCGDAYAELSRDIENLEAASRGYTAQAVAQRATLAAQYNAITNNTEALRRQRTALIELQQTTRGGSQLFTQLGTDIQRTTARLSELEGVQERTNAALNRGLASSSAKIRRDLQDVRDRISQEQAELDRLQGLTAAERRQFRQGTELRGQSGVTRAIAEQQRVLATFRQQAGALDFSLNVGQQREAVRDANALFMSPAFTGAGSRSAEGLTRSFGELPNSIAGINQGLSELRTRLNNVTIGTTEFTNASVRAAAAQRELREATQGVAAALVRQLRAGEMPTSLTNLREVISSVRAEQGMLDTSSADGARSFQLLERQARSLERQLSALQTTQANLAATPVSGFAEFSQSVTPQAGEAAIQGAIRRNRARQERERRRLEREAAQFFSEAPTLPLLLPAAGQTSAPGTGLNISGGANVRAGAMATAGGQRPSVTDVGGSIPVMGVRPGSGVQRFFGAADIGAAPAFQPIGPAMTPEQDAKNRTRVITETSQAYDGLGRSVDRARRPLRDIYTELTAATSASNGSLTSLRRQADLWGELRVAVNPAAPAYKKAGEELDRLNSRIDRLDRSRRKLTGMQFAQAAGAAITGGIYGGPEGFLGGVLGGVVGGVGGAFAGAAIGAQVGMFRQQLGGAATYAAEIGKLQIALRGIVGSQDAYNRALAAAASVTKDLNVPQETAIQGLTRLSAAVLGAGGNVNDSAFAFRAMSEAIKATGGGAEEVDGALLALTQVFSKGKVSAEELNQIAERLPGTFTLFAKATGRTGPELTKALEEGKVGLNDLMRFLKSLGGKYRDIALQIAASSGDAGARLTIAFNAMKLDVGKALQPIGAAFQTAFADFITNYSPAVIGAAKGIAGALKFIIVDPTVAEFAKLSLTIGVAVGSLAALQAAFAALPALAAAVSGAIGSLNVVLFANPWVALAAGIGAATYALITYKNKATEAAEAQKKLSESIASKVPLGGRFEMAARQRLETLGQERSLIVAERDFYKLKGKDALSYDRRIKAKEVEMQVLRDSLQRQDASKAAAEAYTKSAAPKDKTSGSDKFKLSSQGQALVNASRALGVSPLDLATIIGFETRGTYSPNIMGGAGGKYMGLIQFGPNERKQYGAYAGQSFEEQVQGPVVKYLQDRFKGVGMSTQGANLLTLYRTVLGGNPKASLTKEDEFGTTPTGGVARMGQHRAAALKRFFGGSLENVGYAGVEAAKDVLQGREEMQKFAQQSLEQLNAARERLFLRKEELKIAAALDPLAKAQAEFDKMRADRMRDASAALANAKSDEERSLIVQEQLARIAIDEVAHRARLKEITDQQLQQEQERADLLKQSLDYMRELSTRGSADAGFKQGMESWGQSVGNLRDSVAQLTVDGMKGLEDSIVQLTTTGTVNFQQFAASILADTSRMIVRQFVLKGIMELIGFLKPSGIAGSFEMPGAGFMPTGGYRFAKGGMFDVANSIQPFAMGGVVRHPTLFAYANGGVPGMGLMGEAGPEAVMPLRRLPSGRLGVEAAGGGSTNVTVNVDASGSRVQGDSGRGEALGRAVSAAVQQELIKQRRPGGLLS